MTHVKEIIQLLEMARGGSGLRASMVSATRSVVENILGEEDAQSVAYDNSDSACIALTMPTKCWKKVAAPLLKALTPYRWTIGYTDIGSLDSMIILEPEEPEIIEVQDRVLYHVTSEKFVEAIRKKGLKPQKKVYGQGPHGGSNYNYSPRIYCTLNKNTVHNLSQMVAKNRNVYGEPYVVTIDGNKLPDSTIWYADSFFVMPGASTPATEIYTSSSIPPSAIIDIVRVGKEHRQAHKKARKKNFKVWLE